MEKLLFAKIQAWVVIILFLLAVPAFALWGLAVERWHVFPYRVLLEVKSVLVGDHGDDRSFLDRLKGQFVHSEGAFFIRTKTELIAAEDLAPVVVGGNAGGKMPKTDGMTFFSAGGPKRYFVIFGSFAFPQEEADWGAIVMDSDGVVYRGWITRPERYEYGGGHIGLEVTDQGRILTNAHGVLSSYHWCGEKHWEAPWAPWTDRGRRLFWEIDSYDWHHDIVEVDGQIYTFLGSSLATVDAATGEILSEIHAIDLIRWGWRDGLHLFDARYRERFDEKDISRDAMTRIFDPDPWHFNKVDVLTSDSASLYPEFETGDMLISLRELNLIVVVRPSEERIVWWRYGLVSGQHDPTFVEGHIEVFDNNVRSVPPQPRIVRLDLNTQRAETVLDLSRWKMEMRAHGNFERRGDRILTVDDYAGRVIAGGLDGEIDFVFENGWRNSEGQIFNLQLRNATEIDPETFERLQSSCSQ
jgi:hypothetical protein